MLTGVVGGFKHNSYQNDKYNESAINSIGRPYICKTESILRSNPFETKNTSFLGGSQISSLAHLEKASTIIKKLTTEIKRINASFESEGLGDNYITPQEVKYYTNILLNIKKFDVSKKYPNEVPNEFRGVLLDKRSFTGVEDFKHSVLINKEGDDYKLMVKPLKRYGGLMQGASKNVQLGGVLLTFNPDKPADNLTVEQCVSSSSSAAGVPKYFYAKDMEAELKALGFIKIVFMAAGCKIRVLYRAPDLGRPLDKLLTRMGKNLTEKVKRSAERQILLQYIRNVTCDLKLANAVGLIRLKTPETAGSISTENKNKTDFSDIKVTLIDFTNRVSTFITKYHEEHMNEEKDEAQLERDTILSLAFMLFQVANWDRIPEKEMVKIEVTCRWSRLRTPATAIPQEYEHLPYASTVEKAYQETLDPEKILQELWEKHKELSQMI